MNSTEERKLVYLRRANDGEYWISGLTFYDFWLSLEDKANILLLQHEFEDVSQYPGTGFDFLSRSDVEHRIATMECSGLGDLWWIDFSEFDSPRRLKRQELAELCFLARVGGIFESPFFESLQNRYLYRSHDNGWLLRLFVRDESAIRNIIARLFALRGAVRDSKTISRASFWPSIENGLLLESPESEKALIVRVVGVFDSMDDWMNDVETSFGRPVIERLT